MVTDYYINTRIRLPMAIKGPFVRGNDIIISKKFITPAKLVY